MCFFFSTICHQHLLNHFNPGPGGSGGAPGLGLQGQIGTSPAGGFGTGARPVGGYGPGIIGGPGSGFAGAALPGAVGAGSRGGLGPGYGTGAGGNLNESKWVIYTGIRKYAFFKAVSDLHSFNLLHLMPYRIWTWIKSS